MPNNELYRVFVYGTLKLGQCREKCWPVPPVAVVPAWTVGELYDLGAYPAMIAGNSRIAGQLWTFRHLDRSQVTQVLDQIEVTNQPGIPNEYDRVTLTALTLDSREHQAESYMFSDARRLQKSSQVAASLLHQNHEYVIWPIGAPWIT